MGRAESTIGSILASIGKSPIMWNPSELRGAELAAITEMTANIQNVSDDQNKPRPSPNSSSP
jgi:hypothetical protein